MATLYFDGDRRRIYEVPISGSYTTDADGYRVYTPSGAGEAIVYYDVQRDFWSRFQDYQFENKWTTLALSRSGGSQRGFDELGNAVFQTNDFTLNTGEGWRLVLANYDHEVIFNGNLFSGSSSSLFDYARVSAIPPPRPRLQGSDALLTYQVDGTGSGLSTGQASDLAATAALANRLAAMLGNTGQYDRWLATALEESPAGGGGGELDAQSVANALKLTPAAGAPAAGSVYDRLISLLDELEAIKGAGWDSDRDTLRRIYRDVLKRAFIGGDE